MQRRFQSQLDADLGDSSLPDEKFGGYGDLPSRYAVSDLAAETFARAGAWVCRFRDGEAANAASVEVDRALASRWFDWSLRPQGWQTPAAWDAIAGDYLCSDGWIRLHTNAPVHKRAALKALGLSLKADRQAVAGKVSVWEGEALESAVVACGGCAAQLRTPKQWAVHPQGQAVRAQPLVLHQQLGDKASSLQVKQLSRPLSSVKVLDLTRVLAGPVAGRFLAAYGAQVLRIDPPDWEEPGVVPEVTLGKRCAGLDLRRAKDRDVFSQLIGQCDVLLHGYRPGALDSLGFDSQWRSAKNPGLIDVSLSAYGWEGPWSERRGFDSLVQMSTGIASPIDFNEKPSPLPVQALDHATGYLMAASVLRGLTLRREHGLSVCSRLSLAGTATLLAGVKSSEQINPLAKECSADLSAEVENTEWGPAKRLAFPLRIKGMPAAWSTPAGSLRRHVPEW